MYQHTVVSAAPACGVHVPIRSHVQALWSPGTQGGPSQPRQILGARIAPYHGLPWACSSARCWAPRGSTLLFVPHRSTESAPRRVMTTIQPILALRHVYEPAVQLRVRRARIALKPLKPHVSIRDDLGPQTAVCTHCKARHWELGPPVFRVFGRLYHRLGALIPAVNQCLAFAQTWLINPAEATDTRLQGPDSTETRIQSSTLTKLESMLRTGNRFAETDAPTTFLRQARKWRCLSAIPTPTPEIVDRKTLFSRCTAIDVPMVGPSTKPLARSIHGFHPNIPLCGSIELGHSSPKDSNKEGEDEEEGDKKNGDGEHKHLWLLLGCSHSVKARAQTDIECLNTYDEGQVKGVKVLSLAFTNPLRSTCTNATSPHGTRRPFPAFVIERYSQAEADRLNYIQWH
ncbi:BQ5605_C026g10179 [Microbotryum silenes-dioicae]|uniref:BQ5605_C026g10179 protein n=1 Tax=Microbotryum silenes-dioicae TaxID=796604 RepID=A0A2X0N8Z9_9BASI|nr:BQ5605_C026g10179 [Microbotryum silenes-dioicae]